MSNEGLFFKDVSCFLSVACMKYSLYNNYAKLYCLGLFGKSDGRELILNFITDMLLARRR